MLNSVRGRWVALAVSVAMGAVSLGACGGDSSPAGGASTKATSGTDAQFQWELKFARCLREQGIEVDDPDPVRGAPAVTHDDAYAAASKTCAGEVGDPPSAAPMKDPKVR